MAEQYQNNNSFMTSPGDSFQKYINYGVQITGDVKQNAITNLGLARQGWADKNTFNWTTEDRKIAAEDRALRQSRDIKSEDAMNAYLKSISEIDEKKLQYDIDALAFEKNKYNPDGTPKAVSKEEEKYNFPFIDNGKKYTKEEAVKFIEERYNQINSVINKIKDYENPFTLRPEVRNAISVFANKGLDAFGKVFNKKAANEYIPHDLTDLRYAKREAEILFNPVINAITWMNAE